MTDFQTVATASDVPENTGLAVELDGVSLLICRSGEEIVVVENRCSHQNQPLADGRIRNGYIFCPVHGMRFRLKTGEAIGQLTRVPIKVFETRVVDGDVQVRTAAPAG